MNSLNYEKIASFFTIWRFENRNKIYGHFGKIQKFSKFKSNSKMVLESFKTITLNMQSKLRCFSLFKNVGTHTKIEKLVRLQYDAICGNYHVLFGFKNLS
ncbi:hypothetical protein LEP1GSC020_2050 [Leptospira interrogans serovar Grippotyphosa str. 2006006986]|nr:hypothetical protein LEP1GSC020_2050 [Leptospira interrogans serovar Grippotyphosa str. 2006006986]